VQDPLTENTGRTSKSGSSSARKVNVPRKDEGIAGASASKGIEEHTASSYCPVCSQRLEARRCKLVCAVCGYYMSCSDYY